MAYTGRAVPDAPGIAVGLTASIVAACGLIRAPVS